MGVARGWAGKHSDKLQEQLALLLLVLSHHLGHQVLLVRLFVPQRHLKHLARVGFAAVDGQEVIDTNSQLWVLHSELLRVQHDLCDGAWRAHMQRD